MAKPRNLTKWTVQEALNKEHYTTYATVYDDEIDLNTAAALVSSVTFPTALGGVASIFGDVTDDGSKFVYSKVTVDCSAAFSVQLADKGGALGDAIYVTTGLSPITFTGYDITDLKIKTTGTTDTLGIIAWR
mgnify:CR=1 FL=1